MSFIEKAQNLEVRGSGKNYDNNALNLKKERKKARQPLWLSGQKQSVIVFITDYLSFLFLQTNTTASPSRDATRSTTYSVGLEVSPVCGIAVMVDGFEVLAEAGVGAATSFFLFSLSFELLLLLGLVLLLGTAVSL